MEKPQENEAEKQQRLLIEAQKQAQLASLQKAKEEGAKQADASAAADETADSKTGASDVKAVEQTTDIAAIEVGDDFDLDAI